MKRGQIMPQVLLIVAVSSIVIVILAMAFNSWKNKADESVERSECLQSIENHLRLMSVSNEKIDVNLNCPPVYKTNPFVHDEQIMYGLATDMKQCWDDYRRGEKELLRENNGVLCQICYVTDFKVKNKELDFGTFLLEKPMIQVLKDEEEPEMTYLEYFLSVETKNAGRIKEELGEDAVRTLETIDTSKEYATIFYFNKDEDDRKVFWENVKTSLIGAIIGQALGGMIGIPTAMEIGAGAGAQIGVMFAKEYNDWISSIFIREFDAEELKELGCTLIED